MRQRSTRRNPLLLLCFALAECERSDWDFEHGDDSFYRGLAALAYHLTNGVAQFHRDLPRKGCALSLLFSDCRHRAGASEERARFRSLHLGRAVRRSRERRERLALAWRSPCPMRLVNFSARLARRVTCGLTVLVSLIFCSS